MNSIHHEPAARRFQTTVDGVSAHVDYTLHDDVMVITHTIVPGAIGGRGIAGELVKAALDHAREAGLKVDPACSYADVWITRHPEYANLRIT